MNLGEKIKELKAEQGVTRKEISEATNINVLTIKSIEETGNGNLARIKTIFKFLGFEVKVDLKKK